MPCVHSQTAILPCNALDASEAVYRRLGFTQVAVQTTGRLYRQARVSPQGRMYAYPWRWSSMRRTTPEGVTWASLSSSIGLPSARVMFA
jgi:hypothetical protein